jgi:hypothetical protein
MTIFRDAIKRILQVILLQAVFVLLIYSFCSAYFNVEPAKRSIKTITSHTGALSSSASHCFVWSDNDELYGPVSSEIVDGPQVMQRYLFAFYIPVLEIVTQQTGGDAPSEFSLDNLLYANLKIERLINEYSRLIETSGPLLEGLDVPYISWSPEFESNFEKRSYAFLSKMEHFNKDKLGIAAVPDFIGPKPVNRTNHINSNRAIKSSGKVPNFKKQPPINSSSNSPISKPSFSKKQGRRNSNTAPVPSAQGKDFQLPWLFRLLFSAPKYVIENKIEVIIYICMLYGFYHVIFRIRK